MSLQRLVQEEAIKAEECYTFGLGCGRCIWCLTWRTISDLGPFVPRREEWKP